MQIPIYQVDAFANKLFKGNPAAVCPLENWLPDAVMQQLAAENNLSETVFTVPEGDHFHIRWFTPATEVKLCGHATLAAAHIFYSEMEYDDPVIHFNSKSGMLSVTKENEGWLTLNFPANFPEQPAEIPAGIFEGLGIKNAPVYFAAFDYMVVLENEQEILDLKPDFKTLATVKARGVIATAPGSDTDFVSRCFYPQSGIDEDPVTGSAHTITVPYWAAYFNKNQLTAAQLSSRTGYLRCSLVDDRVLMSGQAVTYLKGSCHLHI